jgi:transcriptional regulator with GAF, ATPase, and Fis domain
MLISITDDIASIDDTVILIGKIFNKLYELYKVELCGIAIFDERTNKLGISLTTTPFFSKPTIWYQSFQSEYFPIDPFADHKIFEVAPKIFYNMSKMKEEQESISTTLKNKKISTLCFIPMQTGGKFIGYIILPLNESMKKKNDKYLIRVANMIGSAIRNAEYVFTLKRKEKEKEMQIQLFNMLLEIKEEQLFFKKYAEELNKVMPCEYFALIGKRNNEISFSGKSMLKENNGFKIFDTSKNVIPFIEEMRLRMESGDGLDSFEIVGDDFEKMCKRFAYVKQLNEKSRVVSLLIMKYIKSDLIEVYFIIGRKEHISFEHEMSIRLMQDNNSYFSLMEIEFCKHMFPQLMSILGNLYSFKEIEILTKRLEQEKNYLLDEMNLTTNFQEIVGTSPAIQNTLNKVKQVAPIDATVLITGETGTGKELIARAIHNLSNRKEKAFITVNCAALPVQLIESELFGHEKGSFTGAFERKIGKFEIANNGTIFLDEIGELPYEVQAKLLRVLQEREFERVGGKNTIKTDIRIIAATNRDLEKEVSQGKFRSDLFFRLNVFPIVVPPLRERTDDIPLIVKYMIEKYSKKIGKDIKSIKKSDMVMLTQYNWPGNVRELEHMIERALIISQGTNLEFDTLSHATIKNIKTEYVHFETLVSNEKEHILKALRYANGKVTGKDSAAQLLGINGKTLGTRMRKLGIKRKDILKEL